MKILLLSPEKKDLASRQRRALIVRALEDLKIKILDPIPGRPPKKKDFPPSLFPGLYYEREISLLKKADFVIADLTDPDFKIGFLVSETLREGRMVLGLYWREISGQKSTVPADKQLFIECFDEGNIRSVLRKFLRFICWQRQRRGKFVVIEGLDGSGKATQVNMLFNFLKKSGYRVKIIDFPRYYSSFHGGMVGRYLAGEFGGLKEINPYLASLTYALDRLTAKEEIDDWLRGGNIVIANRYVSSSFAYQGARLPVEKREEFFNWLEEMEYKVHRIPRPDLIVYLFVPPEVCQKLIVTKSKRGYLKKKGKIDLDINEENRQLQKEAEKIYLELAGRYCDWQKISASDEKGKILPPEMIHQKIIACLRERKIIT